MTIGYLQEEEKEKKKINVVALINSVIGIPTIVFLIFLILKGFIADYLIFAYCGLGLLALGVFYSFYKLIKGK
ncbi:MAG: hypothetical protein H7641_08145 [Candidatus Heimdallarchaeota archaeon]|nr:hypothetical protein [Candidatus Heimdallarchaeota archaeon]MCK4877536.1 hypothetical protein [Candidatus Heimdallarchaeota archaeon]